MGLYEFEGTRSRQFSILFMVFITAIKRQGVTISVSLSSCLICGQGKFLVKLHFKITVRVVSPEIVPEVAVMVAVPTATDMARPLLLTPATKILDEVQVTCVVILWLVPSE